MDNNESPAELSRAISEYFKESMNHGESAKNDDKNGISNELILRQSEKVQPGVSSSSSSADYNSPSGPNLNGHASTQVPSNSVADGHSASDERHSADDSDDALYMRSTIRRNADNQLYRENTVTEYSSDNAGVEESFLDSFSESMPEFPGFSSNHIREKQVEGESANPYLKPRDTSQSIGIEGILDQKCKITIDQGITYNVLVVGKAGSGKTALVNSLFGTDLLVHTQMRSSRDSHRKLQMSRFALSNEEMRLNFSLVETSNYGNALDNSFAWVPITNFIDEQMKLRVFQEEQPRRERLTDGRVHLCIYMLEPIGSCDGPDCVGQLDLMSMREIGRKCNLLPVVSKSDMLTTSEVAQYKAAVFEVCEANDVPVCKFLSEFHGSEYAPLIAHIEESYPLAVISGTADTGYRSRHYAWGTIDAHQDSEFVALRNLVLSRGLVEFIRSTESAYEHIRASVLRTRVLKVKEYVETGSVFGGSVHVLGGGDVLQAQSPALGGKDASFSVEDAVAKLGKVEGHKNNGNARDGTEVRARLRDYYALFNKSLMDQVLAEWSSEYLSKQQAFLARYQRLVSLEEDKFREWSRRLAEKQRGCNAQIDTLYGELNALQQRCQELEYHVVTGRAAPAPPAPPKTQSKNKSKSENESGDSFPAAVLMAD
ncbi:septin [Maudiozyma humilis]|uniref:Septin n=1 Tax=Maudiozyma humilis TaxID=51915 RepID=A0AAV5RQK1_MAUHU|nr:septin [Kazachstania humilis]